MKYEEKFGIATLKKGLILFHGTSHTFDKINKNIFFAFTVDDAIGYVGQSGNLYMYKLNQDIDVLLTFSKINKNKEKCELPYILSEEMADACYINYDSVTDIKKKRKIFHRLCDKLSERYNGILNLIERGCGSYEIVFFDPEKYLNRITTERERMEACYKFGYKFDFKDIILDIPYQITLDKRICNNNPECLIEIYSNCLDDCVCYKYEKHFKAYTIPKGIYGIWYVCTIRDRENIKYVEHENTFPLKIDNSSPLIIEDSDEISNVDF